MNSKTLLMLGGCAAGAMMLTAGLAHATGKANDFPTEARAEYVFACMESNLQNQEFLQKCSCAIDTIAKRITYQQYSDAQTILALQNSQLRNAEVYRSLDVAKKPLDLLYHAEAAAELKCF